MINTEWIKDFLIGAADLVLPRYCGVCGRKLLIREEHLCLECAMHMPLTYFWTEQINPMADKLNAKLTDSQYSHAVALFFYKGKYRLLTKAVKYKYDLALGRYLGEALGRKVAGCEWMMDVDLVVPVPLHPIRKLVRGYNQAQVIAEGLVKELNAGRGASISDLLYRNRRTKSQARLGMSQKADNVKGAFSVRIERLTQNSETSLFSHQPPSHILLVDDVFTSGATLAESHKALRQALVARYGTAGLNVKISVATLACVGD